MAHHWGYHQQLQWEPSQYVQEAAEHALRHPKTVMVGATQ